MYTRFYYFPPAYQYISTPPSGLPHDLAAVHSAPTLQFPASCFYMEHIHGTFTLLYTFCKPHLSFQHVLYGT